MAREHQPTSGTLALEKGCSIGYLPQDLDFQHGRTVLEEAYLAFKEIRQIEKRMEEIHVQMEQTTDFEGEAYTAILEELTEITTRYEMIGGYQYQGLTEKILTGLGFNAAD